MNDLPLLVTAEEVVDLLGSVDLHDLTPRGMYFPPPTGRGRSQGVPLYSTAEVVGAAG